MQQVLELQRLKGGKCWPSAWLPRPQEAQTREQRARGGAGRGGTGPTFLWRPRRAPEPRTNAPWLHTSLLPDRKNQFVMRLKTPLTTDSKPHKKRDPSRE